MGTKFSVSEEGPKSTKYVVTAGGSNAFCGFYEKGNDRKFYIPTLRESVESLKQGFEPCPVKHPEDPEFKLIFVLNPSDLVYVPNEEEIENPNLVDFSKLNKEQINQIYKFTDGSGTTMNFVPSNTANLLFNMSNKDQEKAGIKVSIQNELGLGSPQSKNQNSFDDGIQIKSVCWKLKVDRLGNISKA
jgi:CRISPR-associated endonuclease Csn1